MIGVRSLIRNFTLRSERVWMAVWGGGDTWAGKAVTPGTAMGVSAFWACTRKIAQTISTLPIGLYERQKDGGRISRGDLPLYRLLHDAPNAV